MPFWLEHVYLSLLEPTFFACSTLLLLTSLGSLGKLTMETKIGVRFTSRSLLETIVLKS